MTRKLKWIQEDKRDADVMSTGGYSTIEDPCTTCKNAWRQVNEHSYDESAGLQEEDEEYVTGTRIENK